MADADLVYKSRIRDFLKKKDLLCDGDLPDAAGKKLGDLLNRAAERAKANGRKTVRPSDL